MIGCKTKPGQPMHNILNLYLDDSGTRHPDKKRGKKPAHGYDYFSIGGILIDEKDVSTFESNHSAFCNKWNIHFPLHSSKIRSKANNFSFLASLSEDKHLQFFEDLYQLMTTIPARGIACVIDRPGYIKRYEEIYGQHKWNLCKSAFAIVVERSAKIALKENKKLRVNIERCDKKTDTVMKNYFQSMRKDGMPFNGDNSSKYAPLDANFLTKVLYDFKTKYKSSPLTQLADLYLWPICMGGYHQDNKPYKRLLDDKKLIDCYLEEKDKEVLGIKYYCWELVSKKDKARFAPGLKSAISR